ncbi:B-cell lymphoma/leukemia 11A [Neocloeon triangulifer]|uniref:B-cell lymphoma/leukemia 11A n=1 Tax=Neocloeon triangulifer TaxID=2078957 RepID=UPI00286FAD36|nr:B-cell lymphoma/leukemia 11A [Neocloeon triangulifer]
MRIKMPAMRIAQADAEVVQDILTCGACQKPFALADICKFIQHKNLSCNKENYSCGFTGAEQDVNEDSDDGAQPMNVNSRRPSISAPISGKKGPQTATAPSSLLDASSRLEERLGVTAPPPSPQHPGASSSHDALLAASSPGSRPSSRAQQLSASGEFKPHIKQESDAERSRASRSPDVADACSNTVVSEPSNYVCSTCKQRFQSAWTLMQHVQEGHGIKIYIDLTAATPPPTVSAPSLPPLAPPVVSRLHDLPPRSSMPPIQPPLPSALDPHNPFNLLRMPLGGERNFGNSSLAAAAAAALNPFARPPSSHDFRMEQLVSEQFRLNPHAAGLNLAAALEQVRPPPFATDPFERPPSTRSTASSGAPTSSSVPPPPPQAASSSLGALNLEPQLDFYSQRLRQLAGTTSPGGGSSPSSRKQILTPPFTSPNNNSAPRSSQQETTPPAAGSSAAGHKANQQPSTSGSSSSLLSQSLNNSSFSGNGSVGRASLSPPQMRPPSQPLSSSLPTCGPHESDLTPLPSTPRAQSTPPDPSKAAGEAAAEAATDLTSFHHNKNKSCEFCGKRFKFVSNLIVHRRSHTGEKPYRCPICNHTCSQASKLKRHMKIHRAARKHGGPLNGSTNSTPESGETDSLGGSIETLDSDDDKSEDEEDELEDMELEEEEEEEGDESEEDIEGDAPEDLTTKSSSSATSTPTQHPSKDKGLKLMHPSLPLAGSLVGELMNKFGLSDIQQYNEAYKQALQESGGLKMGKDDKPLPSNNNDRIRDNNNIPHSLMKKRHENGLDKSALQFHEDLRKGLIGQPHMDINPHLFGFDMPFDASKRLKLDLENHPLRNDRDIYAGLSWLPTMAPTPRDLFGVDHPNFDLLTGRKEKSRDHQKPGPSAMTAAAVAAGLNLGLGPTGVPRKESRRNDTCEYCGKIFKNCSNLTVHRRSHTGEKPYKCELCSYACAQSSKLTRHMKTHGRLGKDVYRCRFCEMPFSVPSTLEKHMRKCVVNQNNKAAAAANASGLMAASMMGDDTGDSSASASKDTT